MKAAVAASARPRRKPKKKRFRPIRLLFRLALWTIALAVFWCGYLFWHITTYKEPGTIPNSDAAIVLGAALWNDRPSPGLKERLDYAYQLYEDGKFKYIIVSGGYDYNGSKLTEADGMRNYLVERGVPEDRIFLEPFARSTYENLLFSKPIGEEQGWKTLTVITHDFHAPRAKDIAGFLGMEETTVTGTKSRVLSYAYNESREVLAYSKWTIDKLLLRFGLQLPDITL
ncbi:YdcF family protein [Paenibacillus tarimensis]